MRAAIVNADDFGRSDAITQGILEAHRDGIVTSTSLMVRWPAAEDAAEEAARQPELAVGIHLDFGEWSFRDGDWEPLYEVVPLSDPSALRLEIESQLRRFEALMGRAPTHIDSHQHVHLEKELTSLAREFGARLGVPVRHMTDTIRYCGDFYGQTGEGDPYPQGISVEHLVGLLGALEDGTTEIACHPGVAADPDDQYGPQRPIELATLTDRRVQEAVRDNGVELAGFQHFVAGA